MKYVWLSVVLCGLIASGGCASTKTTDQHQLVTGKLPRPGHIWIYDFADTTHEVPMDYAFTGTETASQPAETGERSQTIGMIIATNLVATINDMGLSAVPQAPDSPMAINDLMIQGYLLSADEGSANGQRHRGAGGNASKLVVAVVCYQMTESGMRKLEYSTVNTGGGNSSNVTSDLTRLLGHGNALGLIFSSVMPSSKEKNDGSQVEKQAKAVAGEIAKTLKQDFQKQGWIK